MSAPRIDTTRNMLDALIVLLDEFRAEIHDIHDLAYSRGRAAEEAKVKGGSRDFALDTNGDMIARRIYTRAVAQCVKAVEPIDDAIKEIRSHLTAGGSVSGFDRAKAAPKHEVAAAVNAAQRRRTRSRHDPIETQAHHLLARQPAVGYIEPTDELEHLRAAVRKMARDTRPDRSRLTPAEQDAWRRAQTAGSPLQVARV